MNFETPEERRIREMHEIEMMIEHAKMKAFFDMQQDGDFNIQNGGDSGDGGEGGDGGGAGEGTGGGKKKI